MIVIRRHQPDQERQLEALLLLLRAASEDAPDGAEARWVRTSESDSTPHDNVDRARMGKSDGDNPGEAA